MTPQQALKHLILTMGVDNKSIHLNCSIIEDNVDELYEMCEDKLRHIRGELRYGETETDISCDYDRHYESKSVAAQGVDGTWIGWTYWYGGGKHSEPEAIEWMEDAYFLTCKEELVVKKIFKRA